MRSGLTVYPIRRVSVPTVRRSGGGRRPDSTARMLKKLDAAGARLQRSRPRRGA